MIKLKNRYVPRLDVLEDRTVPAVFWNLADSVLSISTNNAGGTVNVELNPGDMEKGPCIHVTASGGIDEIIELSENPVNKINYFGGNGIDNFTLFSNNFVFDGNLDLNVALSGGHDSALVRVVNETGQVGVEEEYTVNCRLWGAAGNDVLRAEMDTIIGGNATVNVSMVGEGGNDTLLASLLGGIGAGARMNLGVYGNGGNDNINIANGAFELQGILNVRTDGGGGDDRITVDMLFTPVMEETAAAAVTLTPPAFNLEVLARDNKDTVSVAVRGAADAGINNTTIVRANHHTKVARTVSSVVVYNALRKNLSVLSEEIPV